VPGPLQGRGRTRPPAEQALREALLADPEAREVWLAYAALELAVGQIQDRLEQGQTEYEARLEEALARVAASLPEPHRALFDGARERNTWADVTQSAISYGVTGELSGLTVLPVQAEGS
jgi:hypothetical protein